jgi:hypothetical protein
LAKEINLEISVDWIPRTCNEQADLLSRMIDYEDWRVKDDYFDFAAARWGIFTVDCFASSCNNKVDRFYSWFFNPGSLGVDSLSYQWAGEFCWLIPPVRLIPQVILHVLVCQCQGVIVVPFWPSSIFWPYLISDSGCFNPFVVDYYIVWQGADVFVHGSNKESIFGSEKFNTAVLFLRIDGSRPCRS